MKLIAFGDVHGNFPALEAVMKDVQYNYNGAIKFFLFLGDAVGQGPQPNEVCGALRGIKDLIGVRGDNDEAVLTDLWEKYEPAVAQSLQWTKSQLRADNIHFLNSLPPYKGLIVENMKVLLVHGHPENLLEGATAPNMDDALVAELFEKAQADIILTGHTHIPFVKTYGQKLLINVGSVGQPKDKDPRACYVYIDTDTFEVKFHRVTYEVNKVVDMIKEAGLPQALADRIFYAW